MAAKAKRIVIKILIILVVVITSVLLVRAVLNYTAGKKLENYLADAKAKGTLRSAKDFMKDIMSECPDTQNGAALWRAAEALILVEKQDAPAMGQINAELSYAIAPSKKFPEGIAALVEKNRKAIGLAIEASSRPCLRFGDWSQRQGTTRLIKMLQMNRILAADSMLRAERGEIRQALDECRAGLRLASNCMGESELITALVAISEAKLTLAAFNRVASGRDIDFEALAAWMKELDISGWREKFACWIPVERAFELESGLRITRGIPAGFSAALSTQAREKGIDKFFYWLIRPGLKSQIIWVHERYNSLGTIAGQPYYRQYEFLKNQRFEHLPWYFKPTGFLVPEFSYVFLKEAALEAVMLTTKAGLGCKIYKKKTGHYPENLEAIVPDILSEVPVDPFTGKPLVYKIENGELLIYSLGSNQKDDGGRSSPMTLLVMKKDDDWTWRERIN
jgi:hypothetical protein